MSEQDAEILPIILAGGSGIRLWPLSTAEIPKPLHRLGAANPLLASTYDRASCVNRAVAPVITCSATMRGQIDGIFAAEDSKPHMIIFEPVSRGTGTAAVFAAATSIAQPSVMPAWDPIVLIMPSDHVIEDQEVFLQAIEQGYQQARIGSIVLFGVAPDRIEPAFGYLVTGETVMTETPEVLKVMRFSLPEAGGGAAPKRDNEGWWNSGIVMARASVLFGEFDRQYPGVLGAYRDVAAHESGSVSIVEPQDDSFAGFPEVSLDSLVKNAHVPIVMVVLSAGWTDVGNWRLVYESLKKDEAANVFSGDILSSGTSKSLVVSTGRKIAVMGLTGVAIIETQGALLVVSMERANDIKELVAMAGNSEGAQGD